MFFFALKMQIWVSIENPVDLLANFLNWDRMLKSDNQAKSHIHLKFFRLWSPSQWIYRSLASPLTLALPIEKRCLREMHVHEISVFRNDRDVFEKRDRDILEKIDIYIHCNKQTRINVKKFVFLLSHTYSTIKPFVKDFLRRGRNKRHNCIRKLNCIFDFTIT